MSKGKLVALTIFNIDRMFINEQTLSRMKVKLEFLQEVDNLDFQEKNFYCQLGFRIRFYRQSKNLSQVYVATKLQISQNAYSKIETGKSSCSVYRLMHILEVLDLDPKCLLIVSKKQGFDIEND